MPVSSNLPAAEALGLTALISYTEKGIASRVIARAPGGNVTLFAFDTGEELSEHTAPYDALVLALEGTLVVRISGTPVRAIPGTVVRIPANAPHAVQSPERSKMMLVMLHGRRT